MIHRCSSRRIRLLEGRLPASADELAATSEYLEASGRHIGDSVTFGVDADAGTWAADDASEHQRERAADLLENVNDSDDLELDDARELLADIDADDLETDTGDSTELFARHTYKIVGEVIDPTSVAAKNGSASFRSTGAKYSFFVANDAATASVYSVVYLRVAGTSGVSCFSDEYKRLVEDVKGGAEAIKAEREDAREQQIAADGNAKIDDAEESANEQFSKVEDQLAQAQATIDDALAQIEAGREQLESQKASALDALAQAQGQIDAGRARLADPATREVALAQATQTARDALAASDQYQAGVAARDALVQARDAHDALTQGAAQLEASIATLGEQIDQLKAAGQDTSELTTQLLAMQGKLAHVKGQIDALDTQLATQNISADQLPALIEAAQAQLDAAEASVVSSATSAVDDQLAAMSAQLDEGQATLDAQRDAAQQMLDEAAAQLADAQAQADEGQATLDSSHTEFESSKADALARIAEARAKLASVGSATWYVQDRSAISSFASIGTDASCIEKIGVAFPAIFLTVAILVSLTTAARMVEEERGLIGLYKALGYSRARIISKYVLYTAGAASWARCWALSPYRSSCSCSSGSCTPSRPSPCTSRPACAHLPAECSSPASAWPRRSPYTTSSPSSPPSSCVRVPPRRASASCSSAFVPYGGGCRFSTRSQPATSSATRAGSP